jgi:hypothetical protein
MSGRAKWGETRDKIIQAALAQGATPAAARKAYDDYRVLMSAYYRALGRAKKDQAATAMKTLWDEFPFQGKPDTEDVSKAGPLGCSLKEFQSVSLIAGSVDLLFPEEGGGGGSSSSATAMDTGGRRRRRRHHMRGGGLKESIGNFFGACKGTAKAAIDSISREVEDALNAATASISTPEQAQAFAQVIKTGLKMVGSGLLVNDLRFGTNGLVGSTVVAFCKAIQTVSPSMWAPIEALVGTTGILSQIGLTAGMVAPAAVTAFVVGKIVNDLYASGRRRAEAIDPARANTYYALLKDLVKDKVIAGGQGLYDIIEYNLNAEDDEDNSFPQQLEQLTNVLALTRDDPRRRAAIQALRDAAPLPGDEGGGSSSSSASASSSGPMDTGGRRRTKKHRRHRRHHRKTLKRV